MLGLAIAVRHHVGDDVGVNFGVAHRAAQIPDGEHGVFKFYRWFLLWGRGGARFVGAFESCIRAGREQEQ